MSETATKPDWRNNGVRVVSGKELDTNTPQTPGMSRAAAINFARAGAQKLWAGTVTIHPNAKTGAHHHGALESVIYVVKGRARMRWGDHLEFLAEAGRATSSSSRPTCRIRRSTPVPTRRSNASSCAATRKPSSSISTSKRWRSRRRSTGSTRSTPIRISTERHNTVALPPYPYRTFSRSRGIASVAVLRRELAGEGRVRALSY